MFSVTCMVLLVCLCVYMCVVCWCCCIYVCFCVCVVMCAMLFFVSMCAVLRVRGYVGCVMWLCVCDVGSHVCCLGFLLLL